MNKREKILVIFNPAARGDRARALRREIACLSSRSIVRPTHAAGDARALAAQAVAEGYSAVVAAGGDGTINEVVNGLAGSQVSLGILPVGTMNVFATELGIPMNNLPKAWQIIENGFRREIDLPLANREYFVQLAGVGLDAEVVRGTSRDSKKALGPLSYLLTLAQVATKPAPKIRVEPIDGPRRQGGFVLVGNGRFYGGPFLLFKKASPVDGLLDVLVFESQTHWDLARYVQAIAFGNHAELPDVEYFQTRGLRLFSEEAVPVELDGELVGALPVEFGFSPLKLKVFAPLPKNGSASPV